VVQSTNTIYGNIALIKNMSQYTFFDNGLHLYTVPGGNVAEEAAHFAMLAHPDPKRVLLIGGGVGGIAAEALQHGVTAVDYVELDPMIIKMAKERLPAGYLRSLDDRRLRIFFEDGRAYIKRARELYDVIIVSLGEPYNAMINRFYTREFYEEARSALSDGGILSFGLGASESYLGAQARDFLSSINATLSSAFREVYVITGETAYFLASGREGAFDDYYRTIMKRSADRALAPRYFIHDNLFPRFSSGSAGSMQRAISDGSRGMLNRDFRPISYYYDIVYWSSRFRGDLLSGVMKRIDGYGVGIGAAIALGLLAVSGFINSRFRGSLRRSAIASVAANGFSQITFQVLILISFQALYGYMFYKLGMIISAFMAGLAIGGYWAVRSMAKLGDGKLALVKAQASLAFYAMAIIAALWAARIMPSGRVGADIIFGILPLISGVIGGRLFTIAGRIMYAGNAEAGISGGLNYGVELLGSCVGAVLAATVFVPVIGIPATCLLIAGFNAVVLIWPACGKAETIYQS
jgi:spermidine synthase